VALEAVRNQKALAELAKTFDVNPIMISRWKYPWTEKEERWIISGSKGSGNQSSIITFIYILPKMVLNFMKEFKTISATIMKKYTIQHFKHRMTDIKYPSEM
jgi:hypothetical protein